MQKSSLFLSFPFFLVVTLFFLTRCLKLLDMPIFIDETIQLNFAHSFIRNPVSPFVSLNHGEQPIFTWLLAASSLFIPNPLVAGRIVSVLSGFGILMGLWVVARFYSLSFGKWFIILSFIFSPLFLLHDRLALKDSLLAAVSIWLFYFAHRWFQTLSWKWMLLTAITLGIGLLTKSIASFFILLVPFSLLSVPLRPLDWKKLIWQGVLFGVIAFGMHSILRLSSGYVKIDPRNAYFLIPLEKFLENPFQLVWANGSKVMSWLSTYLGWPIMIGGFLSPLVLWEQRQRSLFVLMSWIFIPLGIYLFVGRVLFPRYFLFTLLFWYLLVGIFLEELFKVAKQNFGRVAKGMVGVSAFLFLGPPFLLSTKILYNLPQAPIAPIDRWQFLEAWPSGYGFSEALEFFRKQPGPCTILTEEHHYLTTFGFPMYLKESNCKVKAVPIDEKQKNLRMIRSQFPGPGVFLVLNRRQTIPQMELLQELVAYPKVGNNEFLRIFKFRKE